MSATKSLQGVVIRDSDSNDLDILLDGSIRRLQAITKALNVAGTQINPATEETLATLATEAKLELVRALLATIDADTSALALVDYATQTTLEAIRVLVVSLEAKDFATQTTLALADGRLTTIDAVLDSIKDVDGIKKITDPLPAGTNDLGSVDIIHPDGTTFAVKDAVTLPAGTPSIMTAGLHETDGKTYQARMRDDVETPSLKRIMTEAQLAPGSTVNVGTFIPANPAALELDFCKNGGSENMLVDGSVTPVEFSFSPSAGGKLSLQSLLIVFTADDFSFDGGSFGPNAKLTNGILVDITIAAVNTPIFNIKQNEDFLRVPGRLPLVNNTGPKDVLGVSFSFGGVIQLDQAAGDKISVRVRDNLTSIKLKYLTATAYGVKVT